MKIDRGVFEKSVKKVIIIGKKKPGLPMETENLNEQLISMSLISKTYNLGQDKCVNPCRELVSGYLTDLLPIRMFSLFINVRFILLYVSLD